jgi:hypothetical protein
VDQSSEDVAASDAAEVGGGSRHRFGEVWRPLVEGAVGAVSVEVVDVAREDSFEVAAVEDQEPIEALTADGADPPLRVRVRLGCAHRCSDDPDRFGAEDLVEGGSELAVAVMDQEPDRSDRLVNVSMMLRACWVAPSPDGLAVTPARYTFRVASSMNTSA